MKKKRIIAILSLLLAMGLTMTSCVNDDQSDCTLDLRFRYVYNMQGTDGFEREADKVVVYVLDSEKKIIACYTSEEVGGPGKCVMRLPVLSPGKYTFVAWATGTKEKDYLADFDIAQPGKGDSHEDLTARLRRTDDIAKNKLNSLLNGVLEAEISGKEHSLTIDMMKCTKALRVILMPARIGQTLANEDFDIRIDGVGGWLAYDASPYAKDPLVFRPYYQALERSEGRESSGPEIDNAVVADMNTSRIMYDSNPRLVIKNNKTGRDVLDINLSWLLSLQAIGEHKGEWGNQEYLDRQDEYAMTFFFDDSTWMENRIIVNGWALSLEDADLK